MHSGVLHGLARTWLQWSAPAACHPSLTQCHPERSEGSRYPSREILRGVHPERSEGLRMTLGGRFVSHGLVSRWCTMLESMRLPLPLQNPGLVAQVYTYWSPSDWGGYQAI